MKIILRILGILLIVMGTIWILLGVNILPGSFMTGQIVWAYRGGATALGGAVLLIVGLRSPRNLAR
jgi:hypothetical protein